MSRELFKMNMIASVQKLDDEDIEIIQNYIEKIEEENNRLNNIINKTKEYLEYQISQLDFYEDTKAKMLGSMAIVFLKGSEKE